MSKLDHALRAGTHWEETTVAGWEVCAERSSARGTWDPASTAGTALGLLHTCLPCWPDSSTNQTAATGSENGCSSQDCDARLCWAVFKAQLPPHHCQENHLHSCLMTHPTRWKTALWWIHLFLGSISFLLSPLLHFLNVFFLQWWFSILSPCTPIYLATVNISDKVHIPLCISHSPFYSLFILHCVWGHGGSITIFLSFHLIFFYVDFALSSPSVFYAFLFPFSLLVYWLSTPILRFF